MQEQPFQHREEALRVFHQPLHREAQGQGQMVHVVEGGIRSVPLERAVVVVHAVRAPYTRVGAVLYSLIFFPIYFSASTCSGSKWPWQSTKISTVITAPASLFFRM